ncbi:response regulator transcription factor [Streptomyces griseiscabiei]|uniref:Response regulator transcription factor n=1 Tax=Streptomyces griseiscabiei TaxID=2993540 RepID=A0ABU4L5X9_9ACTN|nr:response regulator transcription factor [Streptomyces griseiscabiei]MBZ3905419.1 response regulator transcription factor [Streptomyces griseiscabiei]MDX2910508.1 response regulator transcription factor [Streptomyces griseiscabiei]
MAQRLRRFSDKAERLLLPAVVLAHELDWDDVHLALESGATGYLLENRYAYLLAEALWCAARGTSILDPEIAAEQVRVAVRARTDEEERLRTAERTKPARATGRLRQLSRRERQVMELLVSGRGVSDVAREMFLTDKTVRNYLSRIYVKLNVRCLSEAILYWLGHLDAPAATDTSGNHP